MSKFATLLTASVTLFASWAAYAEETRYISDDLTTYTFAGPGSQYRITGSIASGEQVTVVEESSSAKYTLIRYSNGKQHWIPSDKLSKAPSIRTQVPDLKQQVKTLSDELAGINDSWNKKTTEMQAKLIENETTLVGLRNENGKLSGELAAARKKIDDMEIQLDDKQRSIIQQWFMYGGGVAGAGLLFGLLLPYLIPRRKSKDRWMN
jgi:SH3 domain protein